MKLRVLGCSGGVAAGLETTALLLDDDILIDCGTGVGELTLDEMGRIRHLFLTHSHLDHCALLPMLLDNIFGQLSSPLVVYGLEETLSAVHDHLFNGKIWPDFTCLPSAAEPVVRLQAMVPGESVELAKRKVELIAVTHTVAAAAYRLESQGRSLAFSGDTSGNETFWAALNRAGNVDVVIVDAAFANSDRARAAAAAHYCPETLAEDLVKLDGRPQVFITHLKPGAEQAIMTELQQALPEWALQPLKAGMVFEVPDGTVEN